MACIQIHASRTKSPSQAQGATTYTLTHSNTYRKSTEQCLPTSLCFHGAMLLTSLNLHTVSKRSAEEKEGFPDALLTLKRPTGKQWMQRKVSLTYILTSLSLQLATYDLLLSVKVIMEQMTERRVLLRRYQETSSKASLPSSLIYGNGKYPTNSPLYNSASYSY